MLKTIKPRKMICSSKTIFCEIMVSFSAWTLQMGSNLLKLWIMQLISWLINPSQEMPIIPVRFEGNSYVILTQHFLLHCVQYVQVKTKFTWAVKLEKTQLYTVKSILKLKIWIAIRYAINHCNTPLFLPNCNHSSTLGTCIS